MPPQGKYNPRRWMYVFVESNFFGAVMMGAIFVSLAVFASDDFNRWFIPLTSPWFGGATTAEDYDEQTEYHRGTYDFYFCFIFIFEFLFKYWAYGHKEFFSNNFNTFDFFLVIFCVFMDIVLQSNKEYLTPWQCDEPLPFNRTWIEQYAAANEGRNPCSKGYVPTDDELDTGGGSGPSLGFLKAIRGAKGLKALKGAKALKALKGAKALKVLNPLQKYLKPLNTRFRAWLLRWLADTKPTYILLNKMKRDMKQGSWRIKKSLPMKFELMKRAYSNVKYEFAVTFDQYEIDHELLITDWESIIDTCAFGYMFRSFKHQCYQWRLVLMLEQFVQVLVQTALRVNSMPALQLLGGCSVLWLAQFATFIARPYLYTREKSMDVTSRQVLIFTMMIGIASTNRGTYCDEGGGIDYDAVAKGEGSLPPPPDFCSKSPWMSMAVLDAMLIIINVGFCVRILVLLEFFDIIHKSFMQLIEKADRSVLTFIFSRLDQRVYALENVNLGLVLLQQWDDMLYQQRSTAFLAWPEVKPHNLLTFRQKMLYVKWAALRGFFVKKVRTATGQCILHNAMMKAEPEAVQWIVYHHPDLLLVEDEQRDTPIIIALKELAKGLLAIEGLDEDSHQFRELDWRRSKLEEIMLSEQVQSYKVQWNQAHYAALADIAVPQLGELVQQLALCFNLGPPPGFVRISQWYRFQGDVADFLAECYVACRDQLDVPECELGDVGKRAFAALMRSLENPRTTYTKSSNFFTFYPIFLVRMNVAGNRLTHEAGMNIASALRENRTITAADCRRNAIDDDAGAEIALSVKRNPILTFLDLSQNVLGPETGRTFASTLKRTKALKTLRLAGNDLGAQYVARSAPPPPPLSRSSSIGR